MLEVRELTDDEWTIAVPARLTWLFDIHARPAALPIERCDDAYVVDDMIQRGLMSVEGEHVELSDRGRKLVEMVLATPLPRHVWADPRDVKEGQG